MHHSTYHRPVMAQEVMRLLGDVERGTVIDATYGGGGHATLLAEAGHRVVAFDRDPDVPAPGTGITLVARPFGELADALDELGIDAVAGVLFDLGVSSHQLDEGERGFSYRDPGPLDMRMDRASATSAGTIVNEWPESDISRVLREFGEERFSRRIAAAIVAARPIADTVVLARIVTDAIPAATRRTGGHPARRTFQALRIAVNDELDELRRGLDAALDRLAPGGRCVVISYHSLEDRIVKRRFVEEATGCICPPEFPECQCGRTARASLVTRKPIRPSEDEIATNPRARSALLRAVERNAA
ncbi:MAG: 16S rRNA (cytosine(1402)-N(4))-methyltransferase RsmH [Acidimicrobiia bacterium]|nr:16S rRNA (cytosine(1402)-N(4))-methyltransferase RsmH [Acidimicrobiia bacterium]